MKIRQTVISLALMAAVLLIAGSVTTTSMAHGPGNSPPDRLCPIFAWLGIPKPNCKGEEEEVGDSDLSEEIQAQLNALQLSVLPFFNYDVAVSAGWDTILGGCVESPMGGMGYHLHNMDQLGNGYLTLLRPEVLLYAPMEDGSMEFLGVEYIIPGELWESDSAPHFLGQDLHFNPNVGPFGIWALHVWVVKDNPNGIFDDWHPDVSCQYAPD